MSSGPDARGALEPCTLGQLCAYLLRLGTLGFGGPIALAGAMERDLVESRRWVSRQDYLQGLTLAQLAPGPMAAQLAIFLGYARSGVPGATAAGIAFIGPSFLMVLGLAAAYTRYGGLPWVQAAFYGIGAAVVGIIARSAYKLTKATVARKPLLWAAYAAMAATTFYTRSENPWLFLVCGALSVAVYAPRARALAAVVPWLGLWAPAGKPAADGPALERLFLFFLKSGAFVFGSGLAIVPFLYGGVVRDFHWLTERQFLDAVAVAMITPGPVVIAVVFIGYLAAGLAGACLAAAGVFLPVYLFVVVPAGWFRRHGADPTLKAFVEGVTAAAVGALAGAALVLARGAVFDAPTLVIAAVSLAAVVYAKAPEPLLVAAAAAAGLLLRR